VTEIVFDGFIDAGNYHSCEQGLEDAYVGEDHSVILYFSNVHCVNSTGISAMIRLHELFKQRGGVLCLVKSRSRWVSRAPSRYHEPCPVFQGP